MSEYRVTFVDSVVVEADDEREAQAVAEERISLGCITCRESVQVDVLTPYSTDNDPED